MFRRMMLLVAGLILPAIGAAEDKTPLVFHRSGTWVVDYDRDSCHLFAQFGSGDDVMAVRFSRYQPGDGFDLNVYGNRLPVKGPRSVAKVDFGLGAKPVERNGMNGDAGSLHVILLGGTRVDGWVSKGQADEPPRITPAQEAKVTGLTLAIAGAPPMRFEFGSLGKPLEQLRDCTSNLVKSWGYDPVEQAALTKAKPATPPANWVQYEDYPRKALAKSVSGIVQFRLDLDISGKVLGCSILGRTGPDEFAERSCEIMKRRAKLDPARDANGKPVRSFFISKFSWLIP